MKVDLLMAELEADEGRRLRVYVDSLGVPTIGVGRNLRDVGISDAEADALLAADVGRAIRDLDAHLPWWRRLDEERQRVLCNMTFNLGIGRLCTFVNTLRAMEAGDYGTAADEMLASLWCRQVGPRALRLAERMRRGTPGAG